MKRLIFVGIPGFLLVVILVTALLLWQMKLLTRKGVEEASDFLKTNSVAALVDVIMVEAFGVAENETDPSYGRVPVPGRGHAPWVMRSNLDNHPRMINFALEPGRWVSYHTQSASLYQVLQGDITFEGAAYNYRHGPQPFSTGEYLLRPAFPQQWVVEVNGSPESAVVNYRGHRYNSDRSIASLLYTLSAAKVHIDIEETPELNANTLSRHIIWNGKNRVGWRTAGDSVTWIENGRYDVALGPAQAVVAIDQKRSLSVEEQILDRGKTVIQESDCLGCHNETQRVVGPAFARISQRFRGYIQQNSIDGLADSIINGGGDKWGKVPMPPHPDMSRADASAAATYILSLGDIAVEAIPPLNADGEPYSGTYEYDVGPRLQQVHPAFTLENLLPDGFEPKVGGMDFRSDGKLVLSSWDTDGGVFLLDPQAPPETRVTRIAEGLQEPLGLKVLNDKIYVLQKQELTLLLDHDGDEIIDEYRTFSNDWPTSANFHSFAFGLEHRQGYFYALLSICVLPGGASCHEQLPTQGKLLRISDRDGSADIAASGFRTPNGIGMDAQQRLFVNDNQGDWLPASKLVHIQNGKFYGSRAVADPGVMSATETPPVAWMPQDEIGNSPTQPFLLTEGPYAGQMMHGDVYHGGVKRVYMESVNGALQGAVMRFSAGFMGGVNRIARGPDGVLYIGEIGNPPNWGQPGKAWHGLERMHYTGEPVFELLQVNAQPDGFTLSLGKPLASEITLEPGDLQARQWFYHPNELYGGPKYDDTALEVTALELSPDRSRIRATIPGLKAGYVVYLRLNDRLRSGEGDALWTSEAWYTLNQVPERDADLTNAPVPPLAPNTLTPQELEQGWELLFDGHSLGEWRNYGSPPPARKWVAENGTLALIPGKLGMLDMISSAVLGGGSGDLIYGAAVYEDFELRLEWKISENGNSGIFYYVADETHNSPWETGIEMQVLHNEGHADGRIHTHRAGDLYDLVAADPETVLPPGRWNTVRIRVVNNQIEHWLNGVKVVNIKRFSERWNALLAESKFADMPDFGKAKRGYIVLQDHGDPVWFRNIKMKAL